MLTQQKLYTMEHTKLSRLHPHPERRGFSLLGDKFG